MFGDVWEESIITYSQRASFWRLIVCQLRVSADLVRGGGGGGLGEGEREEEDEAAFSGGRSDSSLDLEEPEKDTLCPLEVFRAVSLGRMLGK